MILFVGVIGLIASVGIRIRQDDDKILSKTDTTIINAIFVLCIFLSHSTQYYTLSNNNFDGLYRHFQNFHNQWVVATFLTFSGFGVMSQIKNTGGYIAKYPQSRILKTLFNFDIAVLLYFIMNLWIREPYSVLTILGSFIGITSIGNSNWYIFAILIMYILSYIAAKFFEGNYERQAIVVTVGTIVYIIVMKLMGMPSRFISTICCYPLGVWLLLYHEKIVRLFKRKKIVTLMILLIILAVTYKLRYNDYIMNIASCAFVLLIVWFNIFFKIRSKVLYFIGEHAFSIFILQRLPMIAFKHYGILIGQPYVFVTVNLIITIIISIGFDRVIGKIDKKFFA